MLLEEVLEKELVRFSKEKKFTKGNNSEICGFIVAPSDNFEGTVFNSLETELKAISEDYAGATFVSYGTEFPERFLKINNSADWFCWVTRVAEGGWFGCSIPYRELGVIVTWTTSKRESEWKATAPHLNNGISIEEFHLLRSIDIEEKG